MPSDLWKESGACASTDPELFFSPDDERGKVRRARANRAKAVCFTCPVLETCRAHALDNRERYGVWGGLDEDEREAVWARRRRVRVRTDAQRERDRVAKAASRRLARAAS